MRTISLSSDEKRSINYSLLLEHGRWDSAHNEQQVDQLGSLLSVTESIQQEMKQAEKRGEQRKAGEIKIKIKKSGSI